MTDDQRAENTSRKGEPSSEPSFDPAVEVESGFSSGELRDHGGIELGSMIRSNKDAEVLLWLWTIKKTVWPLLWFGLAVAYFYLLIIARDPDALDSDLDGLGSISETFGLLLSPLFLVLIALALRFIVGWVALAAVYRQTVWITRDDYPDVGRMGKFIRMVSDRLNLASSHRSLRWTWAARRIAMARPGVADARFALAYRIIRIANIAAIVILILTMIVGTIVSAPSLDAPG